VSSPLNLRRELTPTLGVAAVFLCAAATIALVRLNHWQDALGTSNVRTLAAFGALASPLIYLCGCALVWWRPRFGYAVGLVAGLISLPSFVWNELSRYESSWVSLNLPAEGSDREFVVLAELKILAVALIVVSTTCSSLRLLPPKLSLRNAPAYRRTWPAFAVGLLVLAAWWAHSATPFRLPYIVDGVTPEFRILHVEKHGLLFHETTVMAERDRRFWVVRHDRRLFNYRSCTKDLQGVLSQTAYDHATALLRSPELWKLRTLPAVHLRSWDAEGWYVVLRDSRLFVFTSEYKTAPPQEVTDLFHEIENLPGTTSLPGVSRDVSLGFGYGPVAGLGFVFSNQPCFALTTGTTRCR